MPRKNNAFFDKKTSKFLYSNKQNHKINEQKETAHLWHKKTSFSNLHLLKPTTPFQYLIVSMFLSSLVIASLPQSEAKTVTKPDSTPKNSDTGNLMQKINDTCSTMFFAAGNKPIGSRMDFLNGYVVRADNPQQHFHTDLTDSALMLGRSNLYKKTSEIIDEIQKEADKIVKFLSQDQIRPFLAQVKNMKRLSHVKRFGELGYDLGSGGCGEHTAYNVFKILQICVANKMVVKLQRMTVKHSQGTSHEYLLINSSGEDIDIKNDQKKVNAYLKKQQTGWICDSWNEGYFEAVAKNTNNLYSKGDSLQVYTEPTVFDFSNLAPKAVKFFKKYLKKLELSNFVPEEDNMDNRRSRMKAEL